MFTSRLAIRRVKQINSKSGKTPEVDSSAGRIIHPTVFNGLMREIISADVGGQGLDPGFSDSWPENFVEFLEKQLGQLKIYERTLGNGRDNMRSEQGIWPEV